MNTERSAAEALVGDIPAWVNKTPDDNSYGLVMHGWEGAEIDGVDLTREEYIWLKQQLAAKRGYALISDETEHSAAEAFASSGRRDDESQKDYRR